MFIYSADASGLSMISFTIGIKIRDLAMFDFFSKWNEEKAHPEVSPNFIYSIPIIKKTIEKYEIEICHELRAKFYLPQLEATLRKNAVITYLPRAAIVPMINSMASILDDEIMRFMHMNICVLPATLPN